MPTNHSLPHTADRRLGPDSLAAQLGLLPEREGTVIDLSAPAPVRPAARRGW